MNRTLIALLLVGGAAVPATIMAIGLSTNRYPVVRLARVDGVTVYKPVTLPSPVPTSDPTDVDREVPRAEVSIWEHAFGIVEPLRTHRHTFEVRNTGSRTLTLKSLGTTCKCLDVAVIDENVLPGQVGRVRVAWNAKPTQDVFLQRASVATNDPGRPTLQFTVRGRTRLVIAADPPLLTTAPISPGDSVTLQTRIVSQVWDAFAMENVQLTIDGATWEIAPIEPKYLAEQQAKSGWKLSVTLPNDLPSGAFRGAVRWTARPVIAKAGPGDAVPSEPMEREIPIEGRVQGRVAVYGDGVEPWGVIRLGRIAQDIGYEGRFLVKVNDPDPVVGLRSCDAQPAFVELQWMPHPRIHKPGIYQLLVRIPPQSTAGAYQGENRGRVSLHFTHPRVESLEFGLEMVVAPPQRGHLGQVARDRAPDS